MEWCESKYKKIKDERLEIVGVIIVVLGVMPY